MQPAPLGRALEERGFELLWVPEHTHVPSTRLSEYPSGGPLPRPYYDIYDPFLALNTAATATTNLKIGTGICLVVQRDPIVTAKMVSSIDQLSRGRFLFGVGNGWNRDEIENHGTTFSTRNKLARERIEAMQTIWTHDEPAYEGEFVKFEPNEPMAQTVSKALPAYHRRRCLPVCSASRYPLRQRLDSPRRPAKHDGVGTVIKKFRDMAIEAGRDPASLPISIFRVPDDLAKLRFCQEIEVDRVVFSLPAENKDKVLPILDRWVEVKRTLGI